MTHDEPAGDAIGPGTYPIAELRAAALRGEGGLARPLALALLGRESYPQKVADLEALLMDAAEAPRLRAMAAQILGQTGAPAAVRVLEGALSISDDVALRGVLHGLSLAGGDDARRAIQPLARRRGSVGEAVRSAGTLLRHRLGAPGAGVQPPARTLRVSPKSAAPIAIRPASGARVGEAIAAATEAVPTLDLTPAGAVSLQCFDRDLLFVFDVEVAALGVVRLEYAKAEAGVVIARKVREGAGWEVKHHVLTEPRRGGGVRITVTSSRGRPLYTGTAVIRGDRADFTLRAVETRGVAAIDVRGTFANGRLSFDVARSDPRMRRKPAAPRPLREEPA